MIKSEYDAPMPTSEIHFRLLLSTLLDDNFLWETLKNGSDLRKPFDDLFLAKCRGKVYRSIEEFGWYPHYASFSGNDTHFHWDIWSDFPSNEQMELYVQYMDNNHDMDAEYETSQSTRAFAILQKVASILETERHESNVSPIKAFVVQASLEAGVSIYQIRQEGYEIQPQHYNWIWKALWKNDYLTSNEEGWSDFCYPPAGMSPMKAQRKVIKALQAYIQEGGFGNKEIKVWGI